MAFHCETTTPARCLFDTVYSMNTPVCKKNLFQSQLTTPAANRAPKKTTFESPFSIKSLLNLDDSKQTVAASTPPATVHSSIMSGLVSYPVFNELTKTLAADINSCTVPSQLFQTISPQQTPVSICTSALKNRFNLLKCQLQDHTKLLELESFYLQQSQKVEYECHSHLSNCHPAHQHAINCQYDHQLSLLIGRVESSLRILESSTTFRDPISHDLVSFETRNQEEDYTNPGNPLLASTPKKCSLKAKRHQGHRKPYSRQSKCALDNWFSMNIHNPYPTEEVCSQLATETGLTTSQIRKWFANKRQRGGVNKKLINHLTTQHRQSHELFPCNNRVH
ncbi:unnamed protein product [Owenia fusiformis]|uniref:Uncharacterized protein n=1 Tax=Owenia fusiformis TaxID=6347 RepID=A0A8J1XFM8_OWEFU|nr:unnamed protein product [Owenia fusiformis]